MHYVLAINPGSTSTKIAVFYNSSPAYLRNIQHNTTELGKYPTITSQLNFRKNAILEIFEFAGIKLQDIHIIMGRGGILRPIKSGVYRINQQMKDDLNKNILGQHASNLGALIADELANEIPGCTAFIADPVVVDEMQDVARYSGHPEFSRKSIFHALNHKATGRAYAHLINKKYEDLNLVVAHLGGGISVAAHSKGRVIDVNQALDGEGPFSPERSGTLPIGDIVRYCKKNQDKTLNELLEMITGKGGYMSYLQTNSAYEVELAARDGDKKSGIIQDAMSYQTGKEIAAYAAVLHGEVDAIILTGGIAHNTSVVEYIKKMIRFIAPVVVYPGEDEMHALAHNGLMVLKGLITPKEYTQENMV